MVETVTLCVCGGGGSIVTIVMMSMGITAGELVDTLTLYFL